MFTNDDDKKKVELTPEQDANMTYSESDLKNVDKAMVPPTRESIVQQDKKIPTPEIVNGQWVEPNISGTDASVSGGNSTGTGVGTTTTTTAVEEQPYIADWSKGWEKGMSWLKTEKGQKAMPTEVIQDYNRWAKNNGKEPLDAFQFYPWLQKYDATKTIGENEKEQRKAKNQEKWERIGNVLSHIGNFVGTLTGAPSQKLETGQEMTKRQQELYDKVMKQRQLSTRDMMSAYYKQLAEERKREIAEQTRKYKEAEQNRKDKESGSRIRVNDSTIEKNQAQEDATRTKAAAYNRNMEAKTRLANRQAQNLENGQPINGARSSRRSGSRRRQKVSDVYDKQTKTVKEKNDDGTVTTTTTTSYVPKGSTAKRSNTSNTPPSRSTSNNTPPSRRKK